MRSRVETGFPGCQPASSQSQQEGGRRMENETHNGLEEQCVRWLYFAILGT